jgi:tetratricopeptide (TPR) repeat protein
MRTLILSTCVAVMAGAAGAATAATTVIGSTNAAECSVAAERGRFDQQAVQICEAALRDDTLTVRDRAKTLINHGVMMMRQLNWTAALVDLDRSIALQNDIGEAYVNRGAVMIGLRRYQEGLSEIDRGIALGIEEPAKAYYNRGLAHEGLENARAAYMDYQQAVQLDPRWDLPQQQLLRFTVRRQ